MTRSTLLLIAGLIGMATYFIATEVLSKPFHPEWLLAFLAMMGIGVAQRIDKGNGKKNGK